MIVNDILSVDIRSDVRIVRTADNYTVWASPVIKGELPFDVACATVKSLNTADGNTIVIGI